ncbi:MAG: MBL fold metallo-hydrolase [Dehalococcoidia bacterium]|nr:MAG: MBL fold metallo-hydrolase [Dehalococcoidia bacterium]
MEVRITTLSENTANYGVLGEWGLSILIEADGNKILMDTGLGMSTAYNADRMGVDLTGTSTIVLSHGHADHTGGLVDVLKKIGGASVIAHPDIWTPKYVQRSKDDFHYIGMPFTRKELESYGARFIFSDKPVHIAEHITTTGEIEMLTDYENIDGNMFVKVDEQMLPDKLADDLALVIDTEYGLVVVLGCAHCGLINNLRHAQKITGKEHIYAVIGGTHLFNANEERIRRTVADLKDMGIQKLGVSHCTGFTASARLSQEFPTSFFLNNAGTRFTLP